MPEIQKKMSLFFKEKSHCVSLILHAISKVVQLKIK